MRPNGVPRKDRVYSFVPKLPTSSVSSVGGPRESVLSFGPRGSKCLRGREGIRSVVEGVGGNGSVGDTTKLPVRPSRLSGTSTRT